MPKKKVNKAKLHKSGWENAQNTTTFLQTASTTLLQVDPLNVRFQHSRIRPNFSGCGRSVQHTLDILREGTGSLDDVPVIEIIDPRDLPDEVNFEEDGSPVFYGLNNRRLWVMKRLREEGLVETIGVRTRVCKSDKERATYTISSRSKKATFVREKAFKVVEKGKKSKIEVVEEEEVIDVEIVDDINFDNDNESECSSDSSSSGEINAAFNPFAALG
ncbi:hypothetical protein ScalyP_jg5008 [Parmales sp. scaly parma]|nr:hypothetical protein ScalyP_jg5008 [Parmales sp. scaly parma]